MLPRLRELDGKKVLIGDNLNSHFSERVLKACDKFNIAFTCLYPNATHLLQPLDVAWFAPLKRKWRKIIEEYKMSSMGMAEKNLSKKTFPKLLNQLMTELNENDAAKTNLISGFRTCGLVPFNPDAVYAKLWY